MKHLTDIELALYSSGDLSPWRRAVLSLHAGRCESCGASLAAYHADRKRLLDSADALPEGVDWESLSAEMAANIRVGLAAGECVTPRDRKIVRATSKWRQAWVPAAVAAGVTVLMVGAWWLNIPFSNVAGGRNNAPPAQIVDDRTPVVEASSSGISLRENGSSLVMSQAGARPVVVSVSLPGSASARFVDSDTGQVTVTSVYAQLQ